MLEVVNPVEHTRIATEAVKGHVPGNGVTWNAHFCVTSRNGVSQYELHQELRLDYHCSHFCARRHCTGKGSKENIECSRLLIQFSSSPPVSRIYRTECTRWRPWIGRTSDGDFGHQHQLTSYLLISQLIDDQSLVNNWWYCGNVWSATLITNILLSSAWKMFWIIAVIGSSIIYCNCIWGK